MIEISGITKSFQCGEETVQVLRGVDLEIAQGERVAIVGASGAGKTTLMHILGTIDTPTSGQVLFEGEDISGLKGHDLDAFRNSTLGFVFQFHQLLPEFTALENVMMPALISRLSFTDARPRAEKLLNEVGLGHRLHHKPGQMSGGEQQRVAIARALVMSPKVLIADEPTGNLDSRTSEEIYNLLNRLHEDHKLTMILVTHSEALASRLDKVVRMADGEICD